MPPYIMTVGYSQQNGFSAGAGVAPVPSSPNAHRAQFRRQGSSYGPGHVHNMAVMVAPQRIDYSVTKGGARSWAVLIVFILICTAMLTIFSDDNDNNDDNDDASDYSEALETNLNSEENEDEIQIEPVSGISIDDEIEEEQQVEENQEEILLSKLHEKAQQNKIKKEVQKSGKNGSKKVEEEKEEHEEILQQPPEEPSESEKEKLNEEEIEEQEEKYERKNRRSKHRKRNKRIEKEEENEDEAEEEVKDIPEEEEVEKSSSKEEVEDKVVNEIEEEIDEEKEENLINEEQGKNLPKKIASRRKVVSWHDSVQAQKRAIENEKSPRKGLLKQKKSKKNPNAERISKKLVFDEDEDIDVEEENPQDNFRPFSTEKQNNQIFNIGHELISIRKKSGSYNRKAITNRDDFKYRSELDSADFLVEKHDFYAAERIYASVLKQNSQSSRGHFGRGYLLQLRAEFDEPENSEEFLDKAIEEYEDVLENDDTPEELYRLAANNLITCSRFRANLHRVLRIQRALIDKFPEDLSIQNEFALTFLMMGRIDDARNIFHNVIEIDPSNSYAQAYYGYILKVYDNDLEKGVYWMKKSLKMEFENIEEENLLQKAQILDSKFYFQLGDGLTRLGRQAEAYQIYKEGVRLGLFPSLYQRSTHNLAGIIARPWWNVEQTGCAKHLRFIERQWTVIREEALTAWNKEALNNLNKDEEDFVLFVPESSHLTSGEVRALPIIQNGIFVSRTCKTMPFTCQILEEAVSNSNCFKDDVKISLMASGGRIWPHCAATNYELEAHLGLLTSSEARLRVATEVRGWRAGKFLIFDTSFENEVWFDGAASTALRVVLSARLWHPEVPPAFRADSIIS